MEQSSRIMLTSKKTSSMTNVILLFNLQIFLMFVTRAVLDCPPGTVNYNNESCYLFLGESVTEHLWVNIWKKESKGPKPTAYCVNPQGNKEDWCDIPKPGHTRGRIEENLNPCVWDRKQALDICEDIHLHPNYKHLANYSKFWHLAVIETVEEDEWLNDMIWSMNDMGSSFWMDLVNVFGKYEWKSRGELAKWFHKPAGIDRWWERTNVLMKRRQDDEEMCYEFHTDYDASIRPPRMRMRVRGWHPRACYYAYEQESDLDHHYDFTKQELSRTETYWTLLLSGFPVVTGDYCTLGDDNYCVLPEALPPRSYCTDRPMEYIRDRHRIRQAPIGAVCEADIRCFNPNGTVIDCGG